MERCRDTRVKRRECDILQRWYWEHLIKSDIYLQAHMDYVHFNLL